MKTCMLCRLPRPEDEDLCQVCHNAEFRHGPPQVTDDTDPLLEANQSSEAYRLLERRVAAGREDFETVRRLAWLSWAINDIRAVDVWSHEASRLDGTAPDPHLLRGLVLRSEHRWREAWEEFSAALRRGPMEFEREGLLRLLQDEAASKDPDQ